MFVEPTETSMSNVGPGQGDWVRENKFRYVGPANESTSTGNSKCASSPSCFSKWSDRWAANSARSRREHVMQNCAPGQGEYVMETAFKYVGKGAGEFAVVDVSPATPTFAGSSEPTARSLEGLRMGYDTNLVCRWLGNNFLSVFFATTAMLVSIALFGAITTDGLLARATSTTTQAPSPAPKRNNGTVHECIADALENTLAGEDLPKPQRAFEVTLDHSNWERYGFVLKSEVEGVHALVVQGGTSGGLVNKWNGNHPSKKLAEGDHIVMINGIGKDMAKMLSELNRPQVMRLAVVRTHCRDDPETTTTTAPPTTTSKVQSAPSIASTTQYAGDWRCYEWSAVEKGMLHTWNTDEGDLCTRERGDGYHYRFSRGDNIVAPGCGKCWCCRRKRYSIEQTHTGASPVKRGKIEFRHGFEGYSGLVVQELRSNSKSDNNIEVITADLNDKGHVSQILLRFDGIVGHRANQMKMGSQIRRGTLKLNVVNSGGGVEVHLVQVPWDTATSYEELGGDGLTLGDEIEAPPLDSRRNMVAGVIELDITTAVQAWLSGQSNYGVALIPLNSDGVAFTTAHSQLPPSLSVEFNGHKDHHVLHRAIGTEHTKHVENKASASPLLFDSGTSKTTTHSSSVETTTKITTTTELTTAPTTPDPNGKGLIAEYFFDVAPNERDWHLAIKGRPSHVETVHDLSYSHDSSRWDIVQPNVPFAAKWSGTLLIDTPGMYRFQVNTDQVIGLVIDGDVILGTGRSSGFAPSHVLQLSQQSATKQLSAGPHAFMLALLRVNAGGLLGIKCMYQGADTGGFLIDLDENALRPSGPSKFRTRIQKKYFVADLSDKVRHDGDILRLPGCIATCFLSVGILAMLAPGLHYGFSILSRIIASSSTQLRQRDLRRYESLALLVESMD